MPATSGAECIGRVTAVGADVSHVAPGDLAIKLQREHSTQQRRVRANDVIAVLWHRAPGAAKRPSPGLTSPTLLLAEGDQVVVRGEFRGIHRGPFAGIEPTCTSVSAGLIIIYAVANGRIVDHWMVFDLSDVSRRPGPRVPPPSPARSRQRVAPRLRHAFGKPCVVHEIDLRVIAEALGHESLESTKLYTQVSFGRTRAIAESFSRGTAIPGIL